MNQFFLVFARESLHRANSKLPFKMPFLWVVYYSALPPCHKNVRVSQEYKSVRVSVRKQKVRSACKQTGPQNVHKVRSVHKSRDIKFILYI